MQGDLHQETHDCSLAETQQRGIVIHRWQSVHREREIQRPGAHTGTAQLPMQRRSCCCSVLVFSIWDQGFPEEGRVNQSGTVTCLSLLLLFNCTVLWGSDTILSEWAGTLSRKQEILVPILLWGLPLFSFVLSDGGLYLLQPFFTDQRQLLWHIRSWQLSA